MSKAVKFVMNTNVQTSKEPLMPYEVSKLPWEEVDVDFTYLD